MTNLRSIIFFLLASWCIYNVSPIMWKTYNFLTLFDHDVIVDNFRNVDKWGIDFNTAGEETDLFLNRSQNLALPISFIYNNKTMNLTKWLEDYWTTGLIVLNISNTTSANIIFENYYLGNNNKSKTISWSMGKSITSALVGIAVDRQEIKSINQTVREYLPHFAGSAYGDVTIENLLRMSSGIKFDENYFNIFSDINMFGLYMIFDWSLETLLMALPKKYEQGTRFNYISSDTQMLGLVLMAATKTSLTDYFQKHLMTSNKISWLKSGNQELAFGTIFARLEYYATFGWLYLNNGKSPLDNKQLISESWIKKSTTSSIQEKSLLIGYGYQWWLPIDNCDDDFMAIGVYNQFIYVSRKYGIVIAKSSAYAYYEKNPIESELIAVSAFKKIAKYYGEK